MENRARPWFFLSMLLHLFISLKNSLSTDVRSISMDQTLSGDQTISSKDDIFELGFFKPGKSQNYYMGIWYKQLSETTVVWVANRETPLPNQYSSRLKIDQDGNLVLLNQLETPIWSTDVSTIASNSTVAELLDTGNFVLRDGSGSSAVIWQSFDHPTDTWLPRGWFGRNMITGEIKPVISWKSREDPALGMFSGQIESNENDRFSLMWNRSEVYWRSELPKYFNLRIIEINSGNFLKFSYFNKEGRKYFTYYPVDSSFITRAVLDTSGRLQLCAWLESSRQWKHFWVQPTTPCEVYSLCGSFGVCTENSQPFCSCLRGFETKSMEGWNLGDGSAGCVRKTNLKCGYNSSFEGEEDGFLVIHNMRLPVNVQSLTVGSAKECELSCLSHCSCTAYAYKNGCSLWNEDLVNLQQLSDGQGQDLFVRLAASELQSFGPKKRRISEATLGAVVGCASVFVVITMVLIWRCRRRQQKISWMVVHNSLVSFSYRDLQIITKNFSEKLGRGSFGSVFKGSLSDSTPIAVKKLEGLAQGEQQFRAEVSTIGAIQHINLIRLRGFCSQGRNRLLVYDYMPNSSLDSQLFHKNPQAIDWKIRYQIALGIARGLAYLHEKCRDRIIHCDLKPENVLLDAAFCPKLADFGMAKLVGREFSRVLTSMRGTIGYLAPEWISGVAITPKADVYSYGMMLFEIISGKRNAEQLGNEESAFFPCWAAKKIAEDEVLSLLDYRLDGITNIEELRRASRVACWCIQDNENDRPSMELVVQILEGVRDASMPPIPWSIKILTDDSSWVLS